MVYNETNLDELSSLEVFASIMNCKYLEDIASILERGLPDMPKEEKNKLLNDIKEASGSKKVFKAIQMEKTLQDRINWIKACAVSEAEKETTKK